MLNREEYNATFQVDLTEEEFARLKPIVLGGDNIKDIVSITAVIPNTLERIEFVQVVRCKECKWSIDIYNDGDCYCKRPNKETDWHGTDWDWFCKDGERREDGDNS